MEGTDTTNGDRRAEPSVRFDVDTDPRQLRQSLDRLASELSELLDLPSARKVRILATEVIARSATVPPRAKEMIRIEVFVLPQAVRLEASGRALVTPTRPGEPSPDPVERFPAWAIDALADRWGLDRRSEVPGVWFEVDVG